MGSRQRRLKAIELTLTPQQMVSMWLRNALEAGTFEEVARHSPPHRGAIANAVFRAVRNSMKGQPEPLIDRAMSQACQEANSLYQLAVNANLEVIANRFQREREYFLLLGYLGAEARGNVTKDTIEALRMVALMFIETVIILDATITQAASSHFNGQPILFRDCEGKLKEQLQMSETLLGHFNFLAGVVGAAEINLEELRSSLQGNTDRKVSVWMSLARIEALALFGTEEQRHAAMDHYFTLFDSKSAETSNQAIDAS